MKSTPPKPRTTHHARRTISAWFIYILRCSDSSLYTGISTDIDKRIANHNAKKGASYTKSRGPVSLIWKEGPLTESAARKCEAAIKKLTRKEKELFIIHRQSLIPGFKSKTQKPHQTLLY